MVAALFQVSGRRPREAADEIGDLGLPARHEVGEHLDPVAVPPSSAR